MHGQMIFKFQWGYAIKLVLKQKMRPSSGSSTPRKPLRVSLRKNALRNALAWVVSATEPARAKPGETIEVRVLPTAKIVEKRLIELDVPGFITDDAFIERDVIANRECSRCTTACSRYESEERRES